MPIFIEIYNTTLYYAGAILLITITVYRIVWDKKFEKRFYKRWQKAREQGFWINVVREGRLAANVKWAPTQDLILYDSFNQTTEERNFILYNTETGIQKEIPAPLQGDYTITPEGGIWCLTGRAGGDGYELLALQANDEWETLIAEVDLPDTIWFSNWSPDGKHLLLNSYEDRRYYLWLMDRSSFEKGQINPPYRWHSGRSPDWNHDGSSLAFIDEEGIWTAEPGQTPLLFWPGKSIAGLHQWVGDEVVFSTKNTDIDITIAKTGGEHLTVLTTDAPPKVPAGKNTTSN